MLLMKQLCFFLLILPIFLSAQNYYYPPNSGTWETTDPAELGWNPDSLTSLQQFLGDKNTKAFIILKEGKIVTEWYYDSFTQDSLWYWASAGKTMTASLIGVAQSEGLLDIHDQSSAYLGQGWTSCDSAEEAEMTIQSQLTMTTGLDDSEANCVSDSCLICIAPEGTRWAYHNGPYTLLTNVIENASGSTINQFMNSQVMIPIGGFASYITLTDTRTIFSTPRNMARFGHLILSDGRWNGNQIIDSSWVAEMTSQSQSINPSYGYLWWLNGKGSHKLPGVQLLFPGDLIPSAPDDMFAGLGKNDQKVYVIPSEDMVVIRMGAEAQNSTLALSGFDEDLWARISRLGNPNTSISNQLKSQIHLYPNPASSHLTIETDLLVSSWKIISVSGQKLQSGNAPIIQMNELSSGLYFVDIKLLSGEHVMKRFVKE